MNSALKMIRLVDINNGQIIEYNTQTAQLLLDRNGARYFKPEEVALGADASKQQKLDLQNAILFNQGKAAIDAKDFKEDESAAVVAMLNDEIKELQAQVSRLNLENEGLKAALNLAAENLNKASDEAETIDEGNVEQSDEQTQSDDREALESLTVKELKAFAEKEGIDLPKKAVKETIVDLILESI